MWDLEKEHTDTKQIKNKEISSVQTKITSFFVYNYSYFHKVNGNFNSLGLKLHCKVDG